MRWRYQSTVLALCTVAFFVVMFARLALSPLVPDIVDTFEISTGLMGLALTGMWVAYGITQFPSGVLGDRYGERPVILLALVGTGIAAVIIAGAPHFAVFILATILLGAVAGFHYSAGTSLLGRVHDSVGRAIGVHNSGATVAGFLAPIVVVFIAVVAGWRMAIFGTGIIAFLAAGMFVVAVRPTPPQRPELSMGTRFRPAAIATMLRRPVIAGAVVVAIAAEFVWQATASFLPLFLIDHRGYTATIAAVIFSGYFVVQGVAQIGIGVAADRFGPDRATIACLGSGAIGLTLLVVGPGIPAVLLGILLLGIGMSFEASLLPRVLGSLESGEQASGLGLVRSGYIIIGATGSVTVGITADLISWTVAFGMLAALMTVAVAGYLFVWAIRPLE